MLRWHPILRKFIIIFLCYSFNLTVAKELTPNPGGVYNQDKDILRYGKVTRQEVFKRKVNDLYIYAFNL